jgi:hypothetical protein
LESAYDLFFTLTKKKSILYTINNSQYEKKLDDMGDIAMPWLSGT